MFLVGWLRLSAVGALLIGGLAAHNVAAKSNTLRLAVPFFAPPAGDSLRQAGQILPELLAMGLSRLPRFQLVEREKAQIVWNEFNLRSFVDMNPRSAQSGKIGRVESRF